MTDTSVVFPAIDETSASNWIDAVRHQYENELSAGRSRLTDYVSACPQKFQTQLLEELLVMDWIHLEAKSNPPSPQAELDEFPEHEELITKTWAEFQKHSLSRINLSMKEFFAEVASYTELSEAGLEEFFGELPPEEQPGSSEELTRKLAETGKLTTFQARQLLRGKGRTLLLGNYEILDKLGEGGMGVVLKARHKRMNRVVALKMLAEKLTQTEDAVRRFEREVEAAARLEHPNIVTAHDADEVDDKHFLVMQYIEGIDLSQLVKTRGPLTVEHVVECIFQAAQGLEYAHLNGVVHRDIKPSNLLLSKDGVVKILDMGLARLDTPEVSQDELTDTGEIMGTVDYMAPEQARSTKLVDARVDIYSLGCTLFYLLTARPPYTGETSFTKLLAHQNEPIPSLRDICPAVTPRLEKVFTQMVAKDCDNRYQTTTALLSDLQQCRPKSGITETASLTGLFKPDSNFLARSSDTQLDSTPSATFAPTIIVAARDSETDPQSVNLPTHNTLENKRLKWPLLLLILLVVGGLGTLVFFASDSPKRIDALDRQEKELSQQQTASPTSLATHENTTQTTEPVATLNKPTTAGALWDNNSLGMKFRWCPPGTFTMGSPESEPGREEDEQQVEVTLSKGFWIGQYEVTQTEFEKINGTIPSYFGDLPDSKTRPVERVSWSQVMRFCQDLTAQEHKAGRLPENWQYTLPTEAQWEYACRAGTKTATSFGNSLSSTQANFDGKFPFNDAAEGPHRKMTMPVGSFQPNNWSIHDMHGNVFEWCRDGYAVKLPGGLDPEVPAGQGRDGVTRGGCWNNAGAYCRSAKRKRISPQAGQEFIGFRAALVQVSLAKSEE